MDRQWLIKLVIFVSAVLLVFISSWYSVKLQLPKQQSALVDAMREGESLSGKDATVEFARLCAYAEVQSALLQQHTSNLQTTLALLALLIGVSGVTITALVRHTIHVATNAAATQAAQTIEEALRQETDRKIESARAPVASTLNGLTRFAEFAVSTSEPTRTTALQVASNLKVDMFIGFWRAALLNESLLQEHRMLAAEALSNYRECPSAQDAANVLVEAIYVLHDQARSANLIGTCVRSLVALGHSHDAVRGVFAFVEEHYQEELGQVVHDARTDLGAG